MTNNTHPIEDSQSQNRVVPISFSEIVVLTEKRAEELEKKYIEHCLPNGFHFDADGWLAYQEEKDENERSFPIKICSRLEIIARTRDQNNDNHGCLLQFPDPDGVIHQWSMPMELLAGDGTVYRQELLSKGLRIAPGSKARQLLTTYIQLAMPSQTVRCVQQGGWNPDKTAFVLPKTTIGNCGQEPLILQTINVLNMYSVAGDLDSWKQVSDLCTGNSRLIFSLSAAFAPSLLFLLGAENVGFHLRGHSSSGKTTCLRIAASVWGGSDHIQQWRATANGLEGIASAHNDGLLCLDEMAQIDPYEVGKVAYMLANGMGKTRADRLGNSRNRTLWRLLFLSSGEISLSDHMSQAKQRIKAGQEVRILDIPADTGSFGCFEDLHGEEGGKQFAEKIKGICQKNYGVVGREFLRSLIRDKEELIEGCKGLLKSLGKKYIPVSASGQVHRAFDGFALIAVAGELATTFGLTGWKEGTAINAAVACFNAWLGVRGDYGQQEEKEALSCIKHFFEQHGESRFSLWGEDEGEPQGKTIQRAGFRRKTTEGNEFYVFPETFRRELCSGLDPSFVGKTCIKHGWLMPDSKGKQTRPERLPGMGGNTRIYRFTSKVFDGS